MDSNPYRDFTQRLKLLIRKNPAFITTTLSNIFTMRLVGNKTHGDLAEIALAEFVNQYMYDFRSLHVGKDLFRAKQSEEDIQIINEVTQDKFTVSLKAYGDGPLQLSTDKSSQMYTLLKAQGPLIEDGARIEEIMSGPVFERFSHINILPIIYNEKNHQSNILVFDFDRAKSRIARIVYVTEGRGRKHPVYRFFDAEGGYICEVRYGGATANALQRGLWTNTKTATAYFDSLTDGWIPYVPQPTLVQLVAHALLATPDGHSLALAVLQQDIEAQKQGSTPREAA